jgi:UDP-N-acetylglucosamine 2-epimerase (non-hydrolysing)
MKVAVVLGTRPEIIKLSGLMRELRSGGACGLTVVHTGQHYSFEMDAVFFRELELPPPDVMLNVGSHPQGRQTGLMLEGAEKALLDARCEMVVVQGDTNSTLAGALAGAKIPGVCVVHVEAGCRSFRRDAPEEVNRCVVDHVADLLFAADETARGNLEKEGIPRERVFVVGDTSLDAVERAASAVGREALDALGLQVRSYAVATLHRAETLRDLTIVSGILRALETVSKRLPIVFPMHPHTARVLAENGLRIEGDVRVVGPQGYLSFIGLVRDAAFVLSDSGGIQTEAALLNTPCLVLRGETEWAELVRAGKNVLVGTAREKIEETCLRLLSDPSRIEEMRRRPCGIRAGASRKIAETLRRRA